MKNLFLKSLLDYDDSAFFMNGSRCGCTCVGEFILKEVEVASFPPDSLGEPEEELGDFWLAGCCGDKASLLSSSKL